MRGEVAREGVRRWSHPPMGGWAVVLIVDFLISFSYTVAPRRQAR